MVGLGERCPCCPQSPCTPVLELAGSAAAAPWQAGERGGTEAPHAPPPASAAAGVTLGSAGAMRAYLRQMLDVINNGVVPSCTDISGADQGVHNYLLHELGPAGKLNFAYRAVRNLESPVHTVSLGFPVGLDMYGRLVRLQGGPLPSIVHQYNRHTELIEQYKAMYPITGAAGAGGLAGWLAGEAH